MENELSYCLQNFAIQSQLSKRCASYPTLPYMTRVEWLHLAWSNRTTHSDMRVMVAEVTLV